MDLNEEYRPSWNYGNFKSTFSHLLYEMMNIIELYKVVFPVEQTGELYQLREIEHQSDLIQGRIFSKEGWMLYIGKAKKLKIDCLDHSLELGQRNSRFLKQMRLMAWLITMEDTLKDKLEEFEGINQGNKLEVFVSSRF
ncbi:hypothetical protein M9H77_02011 [Catharanthus roseus]|uniref:Uncharacterized protein n=1 Tax=Catharanthus roseus TaxID=4058 RepID=A0ACC0C7B0_CATRO|nr:hypothetical protein M9H77_02011 [Catharanthus roseus]